MGCTKALLPTAEWRTYDRSDMVIPTEELVQAPYFSDLLAKMCLESSLDVRDASPLASALSNVWEARRPLGWDMLVVCKECWTGKNSRWTPLAEPWANTVPYWYMYQRRDCKAPGQDMLCYIHNQAYYLPATGWCWLRYAWQWQTECGG